MMFQEKWQKKKKLFLKFTRPKVCKVKETSEIIALLIFFPYKSIHWQRFHFFYVCVKAWASDCSCWLHEYKRLSRTGECTLSQSLLLTRINCIFTWLLHLRFHNRGHTSSFCLICCLSIRVSACADKQLVPSLWLCENAEWMFFTFPQARHAASIGADGIAVISPSYFKPINAGLNPIFLNTALLLFCCLYFQQCF